MTKKDRLSIHIDNGQTDVFEAVTVLRNGGTISESGLVGITNVQSQPNSEVMPSAVVPETIFNVQSSGDSQVRLSSLSSTGRSKVELLANGNQPSSGMVISYQKDSQRSCELARLGETSIAVESADDPSSSVASDIGREISFLVNQNGTTAIGTIKSRGAGLIEEDGQSVQNLTIIDTNSTLQISMSGYPQKSGTLSLREQSESPAATTNYGKIYVKPYEFAPQTQSVYFSDDAGNEFNLAGSTLDSKQGHLYGNQYGNTYGGWYTPEARLENSVISKNTFVGFGIQAQGTLSNNTVLGFNSFSGGQEGSNNTIIGSHSLTQSNFSQSNIILGYNNATLTDGTAESELGPSNTIIIGNSLFVDSTPEDYTLAIGQDGTPIVTGLLKGSSRKLTIIGSEAEDTRFSVEKGSFDYNLGHVFENNRHTITFGSQDSVSALQVRTMMSMRFSNSLGHEQVLMDYDPSGLIPKTATWGTPTFKRPTVSVSGDLRILGDIRFSDGTSLDSIANFRQYYGLENSGIKRQLIGDSYYLGLDFDTVPLASDLASPILPGSTFVATDVAEGMGKMSITSLAAYITSGAASFSDNCNAVFTNAENTIQSAKNSNSVFIGCDVATNATGWKHGVFIGTNAGLDSTTPNAGLSTDTACTYIGYKAGESAANTDNAIFIGSAAGKNADSSTKSIFIGPNAGENSTNPNSIGIGPHAMGGELSDAEGGSRNIEIVAGLDDNQRLFYTSGELSDTLNIQNAIAGNTKIPAISIGKATLTPNAPLEVIRDTTDTNYSLGHTDPNIQKWINNDSGVARVNSSGHYIETTISTNHPDEPGHTTESWYGTHEGFMAEYIYAPSSFTSPTSGWMTTRSYENGFASDRQILVVNRDTKQNIHGPGASGGAAYVVTMTVNGEHRPVYISCSGSS